MSPGTESVSILYKSNNSQATVDPQFHRSKYKFNSISNVHSSNVIVISD